MITIETYQGSKQFEEVFPLAEAQLATAIDRLDGTRRTVSIDAYGNILFLSGGPDVFTVSSLLKDGRSLALVGDGSATGTLEMVVGGQLIPQPVRYLVDKARVRKVAGFFTSSGRIDPTEAWEEPR